MDRRQVKFFGFALILCCACGDTGDNRGPQFGAGTGGFVLPQAGTDVPPTAGINGIAGTGTAGIGIAGTGFAGAGFAGVGSAGIGTAGVGLAGTGTAGVGTAGIGAAGDGTAGTGTSGTEGTAGTGTAGTGTAGVGTGGTGGAAGTGTAGVGTAGTGGSGSKPPCRTKASQGILIGDSYVTWVSHSLPADLGRETGMALRNYAVGGTSMSSGGIGLIPPQFENAVRADSDIKFVVATGGGNDILIPAATWLGGGDCKNNASSPTIKVCQDIVDAAVERSKVLFTRMADAGVKDAVFFFYPHVPNGTALGGRNPNAILDYSLPKAKAACDGTLAMTGGKMRCHFVDMIPVFEGHSNYFAAADVHPNGTGSAAMAKAIWAKMVEQCVGQPTSNSCCAP